MIIKIKRFILSSLVVVLSLSAIPSTAVMAASQCTLGSAVKSNNITFFPAWYDGLACSDGSIVSPGDKSLGANTGDRLGTWITIIAMNLVTMLMYVVGYVSLAFIIWGGYKYMIHGDNSSGTVAARKTIQNAVIGLVISIMSVAIVKFIASRVGS
ncbi:MAG TPA: hypothetical protein VMT96_00265 [Candidatus Bathyarchaeia archaeon]|nr:hypothetical protein [Candidatus Bathyarchaeia archaeon]